MADASYQPKVYRKMGGDELVVASGGTVTIEAGGYMTQPIGAYTTAGTIDVPGVASLGSGADGVTYKLPAPGDTYKGYRKTIYCLSSTGGTILTCTAGTINLTGGTITFSAAADGITIDLLGTSTANWSIVGYSTAWGSAVLT
mgnify:CR=1 FL=1